MQGNSFARDTWNATTELLRAERKLSDSQIAFVRLAQPLAITEDKFILGVGSEFIKTWLLEHVSDVMAQQLSQIIGHQITLQISVDTSFNAQETKNSSSQNTNHYASPSASVNNTPIPINPARSTSSTSANAETTFYSRENLDSFASPHSSSPDFSTLNNSEANIETFEENPQSTAQLPHYQVENNYEHLNTSYQDLNLHHANTLQNENLGITLPRVPSITALQAQAQLNPRYTFDTFVIGESNRFAHATALAVSEAPGSTYNPLFLYSDSGMGKTHLLHAIGNYTVSLYPNKKVLYISSEEFTNAFINALRDKNVYKFKNQFRNIDVLLIDDIQFITNRSATIEEFFHTFNALSNANKQIVITSDVAPKYLQGFEERMISRFASGITANIDLPNLETRIAILEKKAAAEKLRVPREVLEFIASKMTTNVREMEGSLRRIAAFADLSHQNVTLEMAQLVLKDMITTQDSIQITVGTIMSQTANYFDISLEDLKSPVRTRSLTMPRHIAMYLCREMTDYSLPKIAELFNRRDHTTVINALRKVEKQMTEKQAIFNQVSELTTRIKNAAKEQAQQ